MSSRFLVMTLLAGTALSSAAFAQSAPTPAPTPSATPAPRQQLDEQGLTASPTDFGTLYAKGANQGQAVTPGGVNRQDLGGGYMIEEDATKTRSTVTRDAIDKQPPSSNPYQLIELLPGVNQTSQDNVGLNGGNIRIRGFNSDHIGLTIEGAPVNDSGNYALYPQEYVDAENIGQISIAQGSPDLDSPHIGATGGVVNIYMRDPPKVNGALFDFSVGSHNEFREFGRVDTGEVNNNFRATFSYSRLDENHWVGPGKDERDNLEFKSVWDPAPGATIRFSALYNHEDNDFYNTLSKSQFAAGVTPAYNYGLPSSFFNTTSPVNQSANGASSYYKYHVNPFDNLILSAPSNFSINKDLTYDVIPYFWYGFGNGGGVTTMSNSGMYWGDLKITGVNYNGTTGSTDKTLDYNPSITQTFRPGIINKLTYNVGDHQIVGGWWLEDAWHRQTGPFEALNADGSVPNEFATGTNLVLPSTAVCKINVTGTNGVKGQVVPCPTGPVEKRDLLTRTLTNMLFLGDTWTINNKWTIEAGVKQVFINRTVDDYMPGAIPSDTLNNDVTLPTIGVRFKPNDNNQFWASFATTFHSAPNYTLAQSFSSTSGTIAPINVPPPEYGEMFEIGHRYQGPMFATSISGFLGYFSNYQLSTNEPDPAGSNNQFNVTLDAGNLLTYGVDGEFGTRPFYNFRPYISGELLQTQIESNFPTASTLNGSYITDYLPTKGKQLPGAPNYSAGFGLDYDDGHWFGNLSYKYQGPQYSTFMNDEQMPGFGRLNGSVGYRFQNFGMLKAPEIKLSLSNLLNSNQLTGVNSITTNALTTTGTKGGTIAGSTPYYYVGEGFSGVVTMRLAF